MGTPDVPGLDPSGPSSAAATPDATRGAGPAVLAGSPEVMPERSGWVARQLAAIDAARDTSVVSVQGRPVVVVTMRGARSGLLRRVPVMRVEHDGSYLAVASKGGAPEHPAWFHNLRAHPDVLVQDGTEQRVARARLLDEGPEREAWWRRAVEAFPAYAEYEARTDRLIPVFVLEPTGD